MGFRTEKFGALDEKGQYIIQENDDFEYMNPYHQIMNILVSSHMSLDRHILKTNGFIAPEEIIDKILIKKAISECEKKLERYQSVDVPENLLKLLETEKKKEQVKLLKGLSLTSDELISFILKAHDKHGYTYSQYKATHHHKGLDLKQLPNVIHIENDGSLITIGETILTEGQQRQVVEHRKVIVSKFLDNGDNWHCFFLTFNSLKGKESYKDGQPHLHYISNFWNIPRATVKEQLINKKYSLPSLPHIDFHTHQNPREK